MLIRRKKKPKNICVTLTKESFSLALTANVHFTIGNSIKIRSGQLETLNLTLTDFFKTRSNSSLISS